MIRTENLTKLFGTRVAVSDLSLHIAPGEACALLGPLGCGNSSVIKMLATIVPPTRGLGLVGGYDIRTQPEAVRRVVGYMPDVLGAYDDMGVADCLRFYALGHGLQGDALERRVADLLELCELTDQAQALVETLTLERRRHLALARALLHDPEVLLLDKPVAGLDLQARARFFELVARACQPAPARRRTLLISSNLLSDARVCCARVAVMLDGQLLSAGTLEDLLPRLAPHRVLELEVAGGGAQVAAWLRNQPGVRHADSHGDYVIFTANHPLQPPELVRALHAHGLAVRRWREHELDFESLATPPEVTLPA